MRRRAAHQGADTGAPGAAPWCWGPVDACRAPLGPPAAAAVSLPPLPLRRLAVGAALLTVHSCLSVPAPPPLVPPAAAPEAAEQHRRPHPGEHARAHAGRCGVCERKAEPQRHRQGAPGRQARAAESPRAAPSGAAAAAAAESARAGKHRMQRLCGGHALPRCLPCRPATSHPHPHQPPPHPPLPPPSSHCQVISKYGEYSHDASLQPKGFFARMFGR